MADTKYLSDSVIIAADETLDENLYDGGMDSNYRTGNFAANIE